MPSKKEAQGSVDLHDGFPQRRLPWLEVAQLLILEKTMRQLTPV
jgi:hypothetical protein